MIDIHSHILFDVDDGSQSIQDSISYLEEAKSVGIDTIICTPHMSRDDEEKRSKIQKNYLLLEKEAKKRGIFLYLGSEIMLKSHTVSLLSDQKLFSFPKSRYVLVEFRRDENRDFQDIIAILSEIIEHEYFPILAHPELYIHYRFLPYYRKLKEMGVLLQLDGTSLLYSKSDFKTVRFAKQLLKERLIDFVASDCHCTKKRDYYSMKKAYHKVCQLDSEYADFIFSKNQKELFYKEVISDTDY